MHTYTCTRTRTHTRTDTDTHMPARAYADVILSSHTHTLCHPFVHLCNPVSHLPRAIEVDNTSVVRKLIEEFNANVFTNNPKTGENAIHIACRNLSKLRYYFTERWPELLKNPDIDGTMPLFIACSLNDIKFVSWLFTVILEETEDEELEEIIAANLPRSTSLPNIARATSPIANQGYSSASTRVKGRNPFMSLQAAALNLQRSQTHRAGEDFIDGVDEEGELDDDVEGDNVLSGGSSLREDGELESSGGSRGGLELVLSSESNTSGGTLVLLESPTVEVLVSGNSHTSQYQCPLTLVEIRELQIFRISVKGESVLHVLANKGHTDLLKLVLKVGKFLERDIDLFVLTRRDVFSGRTPVEEAIINGHGDCLHAFIVFASNVCRLGGLREDQQLLKTAVFSRDINIVQMLIKIGFRKGLSTAIPLAYVSEVYDILQMLLFYHTQCVNVLEVARTHHNQTVSLDKGALKWQNLQLEEISPAWILDSYEAVDSVSRTLSLAGPIGSPTKNNQLFCQLGSDCLRYFDSVTSSSTFPTPIFHSFTPITLVNLSENQLRAVPPEIFQIPALKELNLSHNKLAVLPTVTCSGKPVYTCTQLKKLNLNSNELTTLPEELFTCLGSSLEDISARKNNLTALPVGLWLAPRLQRINLAQNKLRRLHRFSDPEYFVGDSLSRKMVITYGVAEDVASLRRNVRRSSLSSKEQTELEEYLHEMEKLSRTLHELKVSGVANPDVVSSTFVSDNFRQNVIDLHWFRYEQRGSFQEEEEEEEEREEEEEDEEEGTDGARCHPASQLTTLDLSGNSFTEVPWDLACVAPNLKKLNLRGNSISSVDLVHSFPISLLTLHLDSNGIESTYKGARPCLPCGAPNKLLSYQPSIPRLALYCRHCRHQSMVNLAHLTLDHNLLAKFPIVEVVPESLPEDPDVPTSATFDSLTYHTFFPNLAILSMEDNKFTDVPECLHYLTNLCSLSLSHNNIRVLPHSMGLLNPRTLFLLKLEGMKIANVPAVLLNKPTPKFVLSHLKGLLQK